MPFCEIWTLPPEIGLSIVGAEMTRESRTIAKYLPTLARRVLLELLGAVLLEHEVDDAAAGLAVLADRRARQLLAAEERWELGEVDLLVLLHRRVAEGHEVEASRLADEPPDRVRVGDAGQFDDDAVGALRRDQRLGDAGRVDPALDDVADDIEVLGPRDLVADLLRLVLHAEAALEVQSELRFDRALAVGGLAVGHAQAGDEVDDERGNADDENEEGTGFAHRRRMIHGTSPAPVPAGLLGRASEEDDPARGRPRSVRQRAQHPLPRLGKSPRRSGPASRMNPRLWRVSATSRIDDVAHRHHAA